MKTFTPKIFYLEKNKMVQTAIELLKTMGVWTAIQAVVAISVAVVLYRRFTDNS
jgi:hypothetical protein